MPNPLKYLTVKDVEDFLLCGFFGLIWGLTIIPIVTVFSGAFLGFLMFPHHISQWILSVPIVLTLLVSLLVVRPMLLRAPNDIDEKDIWQSARDAMYGLIGFSLFYFVACCALLALVRSGAHL